MSDDKDYYNYIPEYNEYKGVENGLDGESLYKHPIYKNIPYYNNEIKSLQDINKNYTTSENMDNMYYDENLEFDNSNDVNLIYNDGFPSYRMVNTPTSPRVVDLSQKAQNNTNSIATDNVSNMDSSRTENVMVSEISKLADAIKEFTSKMPLPPSPELLKLVHPNLAVELQLTFLKAYIQNQQLLLDLKSKIDVAFSGSEFTKFTSNLTTQNSNKEFQTNSNSQNYPIVELRTPYPPLSTPQASSQPNLNYRQFGGDYNYGINMGVEGNTLQNFPMSQINCPQLTNYPNFYYPLTNQPNFSLPQLTNCPQNTNNYPQLTDYPQLTNYPHFTERSNYQYGGNDMGNQNNGNYDGEYKEGVDDTLLNEYKNPALLVPEEYRDRVKYSSTKKSFVSVFLNSLGVRRRKFFSINKFGLNKALKMAINFSNQLSLNNNVNKKGGLGQSDFDFDNNNNYQQNGTTSAPDHDNSDTDINGMGVNKDNFRLAVRERNLIEEVCEHALKLNDNSVENFELFDRALVMDRVRGLVYSPGANIWMCIFYKKRKRKLQCFSVQEFGFDKCYQMGQTFFKNNPQVVRSKLSGVLSYWLEPRPTKTLVVIFKIKTSLQAAKYHNTTTSSNHTASYTVNSSNTFSKDTSSSSSNRDRENNTTTSTTGHTTTNSINTKDNNEKNTTKVGSKDDVDVLYLGRFELEVYGGFLPAKKASQGWCNQLNKYHSQLNGMASTHHKSSGNKLDGTKTTTNSLDQGVNINSSNTTLNSTTNSTNFGSNHTTSAPLTSNTNLSDTTNTNTNTSSINANNSSDKLWNRLGFVYYDDYNKIWVVVKGSQTFPFSSDTLGHLESKKQAIALRQEHILTLKSTNL